MAEYFSLRAITLQSPNYSHSASARLYPFISLSFLFHLAPCVSFLSLRSRVISSLSLLPFTFLVYSLPHVFLKNMFSARQSTEMCDGDGVRLPGDRRGRHGVRKSREYPIGHTTVSVQSVEYESHTICSVHEKSFRVLRFTTLDSIR